MQRLNEQREITSNIINPHPVYTYEELVAAQRIFFHSGQTLSYQFRLTQLKKLLRIVEEHEEKILNAIYLDLHKSKFEAWGVEAGVIEAELKYAIRHLRKWMRPEKLRTPLFHFRAKSYIQKIPYGVTLVIAPWNYPFQLALRPVVGAIAAGNTCIIKPSEQSPHTAQLLERIINDHFPPEYLHVKNADATGTQQLLNNKFDFIFFTGGTRIGQHVYEAAAKHLTPVALELGGKNPCIVDETCNLNVTADRITWGKFSNAGQTCVAPDYLLVHQSIKDELVRRIIANIERWFGDDIKSSADFGRMINDNHVMRIEKLLAGAQIRYGGTIDKTNKYISPTLVEIADLNSPLMQEEIFGPVLPIITYTTIEEITSVIQRNHDPLVLYVFTSRKQLARQLARTISSGDMVVNEVVLHFGHLKMPIGGKGNSGIGKYQGRYSFEEFSHKKSVMHRSFYPDLSVRYPPYSEKKLRFLQTMFKWFFGR